MARAKIEPLHERDPNFVCVVGEFGLFVDRQQYQPTAAISLLPRINHDWVVNAKRLITHSG